MAIKLNFINESNDGQSLVIFQTPALLDREEGVLQSLTPSECRVISLPPAGQSVEIPHVGNSIFLGVAPSAAGGIADPAALPAPVHLALPRAPSATIRVRGGGTEPATFTVAAD